MPAFWAYSLPPLTGFGPRQSDKVSTNHQSRTSRAGHESGGALALYSHQNSGLVHFRLTNSATVVSFVSAELHVSLTSLRLIPGLSFVLIRRHFGTRFLAWCLSDRLLQSRTISFGSCVTANLHVYWTPESLPELEAYRCCRSANWMRPEHGEATEQSAS